MRTLVIPAGEAVTAMWTSLGRPILTPLPADQMPRALGWDDPVMHQVRPQGAAGVSGGRVLHHAESEHPAVDRGAVVTGLEGEDEDAAAHEAGRLQQPGHGGAIQHRAIDRRAGRDRDEQERGAAGDLLHRKPGPLDVLRLDAERSGHRRRVGQR
ncbi:MAG TPA: hypothetical protein VEW68_07505, partial [Patescibacteria group bacterium]|nr:hypothetical protein [Patescibacteria group bacterium]